MVVFDSANILKLTFLNLEYYVFSYSDRPRALSRNTDTNSHTGSVGVLVSCRAHVSIRIHARNRRWWRKISCQSFARTAKPVHTGDTSADASWGVYWYRAVRGRLQGGGMDCQLTARERWRSVWRRYRGTSMYILTNGRYLFESLSVWNNGCFVPQREHRSPHRFRYMAVKKWQKKQHRDQTCFSASLSKRESGEKTIGCTLWKEKVCNKVGRWQK